MTEGNTQSKIYRGDHAKDLVLVTGLTRSGKTMLAPIVSSFERVENVALHYLMELIPMMSVSKQIDDAAATCLMRSAIDFMQYDIMIGRNSNFRPTDYSSVFKSKDPKGLVQRLFMPEGDVVYERMGSENPIFLMLVHDALWHADIYFKAFPRIKMVHIDRHPVDLAYSWHTKELGKEFFDSPRNATLTIRWKGQTLPYYAIGWEDEFLTASEGDRIIKMIARLNKCHEDAYAQLSDEQKAQIKFFDFETFVTDPDVQIEVLSAFIGTQRSAYTKNICQRERCPRTLDPEDRAQKLKVLKGITSGEGFAMLENMIEAYEANKSLILSH